MNNADQIDLGGVRVNNKVFDDVVRAAIAEVDGVEVARGSISKGLFGFLNSGNKSAIRIKVDEQQQVTLDVHVLVRYGINIPNTAKKIQEAIKSAVAQTLNVEVKDINVNVQGISRGRK